MKFLLVGLLLSSALMANCPLTFIGSSTVWNKENILAIFKKDANRASLSFSSRANPKGIYVGWQQKRYNPSYTSSARWQEGKFVQKFVWDAHQEKFVKRLVKQNALFRCDSFTKYVHRKADNIEIIRHASR